MTIELGKTEVNMINPPTSGEVLDPAGNWTIGRTGSGMMMLRRKFDPTSGPSEAHPDFLPSGMDLQSFCCWINSKL